ncbi:S26 family signal peptidase [Delftia acidovorans]|uniref:S26 family signal peptidase n=1 Tax=Delftia acidovorans TaxID=80866 RepID=A0AAJ2R0Q9_DELAC|nr:S26 family signal peptidase [Delftia acidovorans]MDX4953650.1 S26 family signal peptidase [Delftia acidovorans]
MTAHSTTVRTLEAAPHPRSRLRARVVLAVLSTCGLAALAWASFVRPTAHVVNNPSDSVPVGWYRIEPAYSPSRPLPVNSIVLARLPADVAALAAQRGYLPSHIPLLKRVGAVAPQHVCIVAGIVRIDGVPVAAVLPADRRGRPLSSWPDCRRLHPGELFLLSTTNPASFDSRYFGPIQASAVIGTAQPIYLEKRP